MKPRQHALFLLATLVSCLLRNGESNLAAAQNGEVAPPATPPASQLLRSPDDSIEIAINPEGQLTYSVLVDGQMVLSASKLGLLLRGGARLGADIELVSATHQSSDTTWENPFGKHRSVRDHFNELHLLLRERAAEARTFEVVFRAYDDGVAFRYELLSQPGMREFALEGELTEFSFPGDFACYAGEQEGGFRGPQAWEFPRRRLSDIKPESIIGTPLLVETPSAWIAIAEADLTNWAGLWIGGVTDQLAPIEPLSDASQPVAIVAKLAPNAKGDPLVQGKTPNHSPWRVLMIGRQPGRLMESEILGNLSAPSRSNDVSWIKPGRMARMPERSEDATIDTASMQSSIERAAEIGQPYQLVDIGWYGKPNNKGGDITKSVDSLDMDEIRRLGSEKGVRLWLSVHWSDLCRKNAYQKAFPIYEAWGIAGLKIVGLDRDDQATVARCEKITSAAADHQLLVKFDGAFKSTGLERTFPNLIEPADAGPCGFFSQRSSASNEQQLTTMRETRAAELAFCVVHDSAVAAVFDHPDHDRNQAGADFLRMAPTVWDDTRVLDGIVGEQVVVARKSGDAWFLGALTNSQPREVTVKLDFLGSGRWKLKLWQDDDGANADADQLLITERFVKAGDALTLKLAPASGCAGQFIKQ